MTLYTLSDLTRIQSRVRPTYAVTREAFDSMPGRQTIHDLIRKNLTERVQAEALAHFSVLVNSSHLWFESQWQMTQNLLMTRASWLPRGPLMYGDKVVEAGKWAHASSYFRDAPRSLAILENLWDDQKDAWIYQ